MSDVIDNAVAAKALGDLQVSSPAAPTLPEVTTDKVDQAILLLKEATKNGGYLAIAMQVRLTQAQVVDIHRSMQARIAELTPAD